MKKIIVLMIMNIGFAQDFTVDGDLNVSGNKVLNVADPTAATDAVNLRSISELGSMKPNRMYRMNIDVGNTWTSEIVVPAGKFWLITPNFVV